MKTREVAAIALKILAVYVFLQFLTMLPTGLKDQLGSGSDIQHFV